MKQIIYLLTGILLFAACKTVRIPKIPPTETYVSTEITKEEADTYRKNYEEDKSFRLAFRNGMFLPFAELDQLRKQQGIDGLEVYYGKHPDYASPVFIIYGAMLPKEGTAPAPSNKSAARSGTEKIFLVYFPCPTICGQTKP